MPFFFILFLVGVPLRIYILSLLILVLFVIAFIFGSQNNQLVDLNYLIARIELTVAQAVSVFIAIGFFLGLFTAILWKLVNTLRAKKTRPNDIKVS